MPDIEKKRDSVPGQEFYNSSSAIRELMEQHGLTMQKRFGQNFLLSQSVRQRIVESLEMTDQSDVWEVGPGIGAITSLMAGNCRRLTLFEIDRGFIELLGDLYGGIEGLSIAGGDALKTWPEVFEKQGRPDAVAGNLPYNVGSVIIASFIEKALLPKIMVYTVQKEVAIRISRKPGSKDYSSFSMLCGLDYEAQRVMDISAGSFYPKPDVTSSVVKMVLRENRELEGYSLDDENIRSIYLRAIRDLFKARRKTIRNNLIKSGLMSGMDKADAEALLLECGIDPGDRGENIGIASVWKLAGRLSAF